MSSIISLDFLNDRKNSANSDQQQINLFFKDVYFTTDWQVHSLNFLSWIQNTHFHFARPTCKPFHQNHRHWETYVFCTHSRVHTSKYNITVKSSFVHHMLFILSHLNVQNIVKVNSHRAIAKANAKLLSDGWHRTVWMTHWISKRFS